MLPLCDGGPKPSCKQRIDLRFDNVSYRQPFGDIQVDLCNQFNPLVRNCHSLARLKTFLEQRSVHTRNHVSRVRGHAHTSKAGYSDRERSMLIVPRLSKRNNQRIVKSKRKKA